MEKREIRFRVRKKERQKDRKIEEWLVVGWINLSPPLFALALIMRYQSLPVGAAFLHSR
jgi:hypothetical protein